MNDDDLGRLLSGAFDSRARDAVDDSAAPPPPRFAQLDAGSDDAGVVDDVPASRRAGGSARPSDELEIVRAYRPTSPRGARLLLPLSAAAAVIVLVGLVFAVTNLTGSGGGHRGSTRHLAAGHSAPARTSGKSAAPPAGLVGSGAPVHIKLLNSDGSKVGVGMPVIAYFSKAITSAKALQDVTTVTVNGKQKKGAWYFEQSDAMRGYPYEAHLRTFGYWPPHASIHIGMPTEGLTAGKGLRFDDSLTLDFTTGASHIATVDDQNHTITLTSNGTVLHTYKVSLGAPRTPTQSGTKVIMDKSPSICVHAIGYSGCGIKHAEQLTYSGEYLESAPGTRKSITQGVDASDGCTDLLPAAAAELYRVLRIGDVVKYPTTDGSEMQLGQGYGDWNVQWAKWLTGGLVPTGSR